MKQGYIILALAVACLFLSQNLSADTIKSRVVDAETGEPLEGAEVVFTETSIEGGSMSRYRLRTDSLGRFLFTCTMEMSKLTITANYFGYHSQTVQRMGNNDRDTITIDDFRLKMDEHLLSEVTVEGRMRRFYMRGDTVVFNPEAFKTQEGARLIELIEQLPGVSINDGKLLWNGEPLKLMMNGQQAFSEAMLTNVLPVEAVKDIKAYYKVRTPNFWSINGGANHTDDRSDSWENRQTFMPESTATETDQTSRDYQHMLKLPVDFESFFNLSPHATMGIDANVTYHRGGNTTENSQRTFDLANPSAMTNTSSYHSLAVEEGFSTNIKAQLGFLLGKTELGASASLTYDNKKSDGESTGLYQYFQSGTTQTDRQHYHAPTHHLTVEASVPVRHAFNKNLSAMAKWQITYDKNFRDEQRHRADTLDLANNMRRDDDTWRNALYLEAKFTQGKFSVKPTLDLNHWHEQSDYRRGRLDTLASRNLLLVTPTLELTYRLQKQTRLSSRIAYSSNRPDLIECIGYRDDTNLLYVTMGNPDLKTAHTLNASLGFSSMLTHASQVLNFSVDYSKYYDPIGTVLYYNSQTGAYLSQNLNVRGGHRWGASLLYERDLGKHFHLKNNLSESFGLAYGIMTLVDGANSITYNLQRSSDFTDRLNLEYRNGPLYLSMNQNFAWHRYTYSDAAQSRQNIYNYQAAFTFSYDLKAWTFQFIPDFYLDRGYVSDAMNTNRFLCNARVSYKFLKNKASLILYANDLFNRSTNNYSDVTATSRTEGGSSFLHHYVFLTFNYKFDAKKK